MANSEEITLPPKVQELLEPIENDAPCGTDATSDPDYIKLSMETSKPTPDYKIWTELAQDLLKTKTKDLWLAVWLCFSWYRTEKLEGLKNGFILLINLLSKFESALLPADQRQRSKALQFLNSGRFYKLLEKEEINQENAKVAGEIGELYETIKKKCQEQYAENPPTLSSIDAVIEDHVEQAARLLLAKEPEEEPAKQEPAEQAQEAEKTVEQEAVITEKKEEEPQKQAEPVVSKSEKEPENKKEERGPKISVRELQFGIEKEAIIAIRKALIFHFEEEENDKKKTKVPEDPAIYGLSRSLKWGNLNLPPHKEKVTAIEGPNSVIMKKIPELFHNREWETLIPRIEINFLNPDTGFVWWLNAQRFVVGALEQYGGGRRAADEIKFHLARLVNRLPDLPYLKFKNKDKTQFADEETIEWLNFEVMKMISSGSQEESLSLSPIIGEDYESINTAYEAACKELPSNFEKYIAEMQSAFSGETRRKGRFLIKLNLANYCFKAKQYQLAKIHLLELQKKIDEYNLAEWEPALCVAVWQTLYLANEKLIQIFKDSPQTKEIDQQQQTLFANIANYDGVRAINLSNHKKTGGK